ncbi:GmrSD restriction endonuclease domain-containing protein [Citricoccus nitrophenolicus]|uniref:GmrSD restriction endonuclease domain-containing protein n=1 Tax=Citricoccus nitrophenolicus TaxID=863575 RepID=UPI0031EF9C5B
MVAAREISVQQLLEGTTQYQVPLYQRTYSWKRAQMERLWADVVQLSADRMTDPGATHFMGSLVLAPGAGNGPGGVHEYLVVDGQQRLTTLSLLLAAIRDHRREHEFPEHFERINEKYLLNKWEKGDHRYKLWPTQADRESYRACIDATPHAGGQDGVGQAYRFFQSALLTEDDPDDPLDIERIENAVISGLSMVCVTTVEGDNTHRIFESLNNTGLRLTQGDLLRNYIFMRLPNLGESVYSSLWRPLQDGLSPEDLELLFWLDLVQRDPTVKQTDIYEKQRHRMDRFQAEEEIRDDVARLARLGGLLHLILSPEQESDPTVRLRLQRLKTWGTTTVYPTLLFLLDLREQGRASSATVAEAMLYLESFLVRRLLAGRATMNLNRILLGAVAELTDVSNVATGLHQYLSSGRKYFLTDSELVAALKIVPFYLNGRAHQRRLILQWLEESYQSPEPVDLTSLTIEHVLPQTPTSAWQECVLAEMTEGEDFSTVYESVLHTLGNLTLTGYNSSLSNSPYPKKRDLLLKSGLRMNQEIARESEWGRAAIYARAEGLAERIKKTWPGPLAGTEMTTLDPRWKLMEQAVASLPSGTWTTYGDLAALIGSHAMPVGQRVANKPIKNGHRVLQAAGTVAPNFRWYEEGRVDDPLTVLAEEGIRLDDQGRADPQQRMLVDSLALLVGADIDGGVELPPLPDGGAPELRDSFVRQLDERQNHSESAAVHEIIRAWDALGGRVGYGTAENTSCFLLWDKVDGSEIWPVIIYAGHLEVVFQYIASRQPFDDLGLRDELRLRLNELDGVEIGEERLTKRPNLQHETFSRAENLDKMIGVLAWFTETIRTWELQRTAI